MNKRICFAGFTEEEAASIRQAVEGNVHTWECAFAQDGPDAIAEIASASFDAVVATLQMDGMRGDEILQQAVKLQPHAIRFIVGDTSDTTIIFSCIKDGNNFIARTTNPDEILSAVQRGFELDTQVATERFARAAQVSASSSPSVEKPDRDWMVRVLVPVTTVAVVIAVVLWWNRRPETASVLRVKAIVTESPAPAAEPAHTHETAPPALPQDSQPGFVETKVK